MNVRTNMPSKSANSVRGRGRRLAGLIVLLLPALLISMDVSILFVASPSIAQSLAPTGTEWLWMLDSYSFVVAALLVTMGSLADRIGRRRLLLIGALAFGVASTVLAMAPTPTLFIVGRVLLGVAAATLAPSTLAIVRDLFDDLDARRKAVAAWTVAYTGGAVAGPVLGGVLLTAFEWPSVFLINLPVMALLLIAGPFVLPESKDPRGATFDLPGAALSLLSLFGIVFAIKRFAEYGNDFLAWATLIGGALVVVGFIVRQRMATHPLIDLTLFRSGAFSGAAVANLLAAFVMVGLGALAFTYLQSVHGLSALEAALYALPTFIGTAVGAGVSAGLAKRVRPGAIILLGFVIATVGFCVVGATAGADSPWWFVAGYIPLTLGAGGLVSALSNSLIISTAPAHRTGAAASISETGVQLGGAFGIALFGLLSTVFYRRDMQVDGPAGDSLAGAEALAAQMSGPEAALLREQAATAFASSLSTVAFVIAGVCLAAAIVTGLLLRRVPIATADQSDG
ncbi:MFS transporter [uncultured Agrococcus sp.]|uniref:MFS transporter n=1 Tax=uncultured Agrococcus sp. TaxID=382258 RepID=UPI0025E23D36|nr:MFS transporter [uncultured Agrococcus sp.]